MDTMDPQILLYVGGGLVAAWLIGKIFLKITKVFLTLGMFIGLVVLAAYGLVKLGVINL